MRVCHRPQKLILRSFQAPGDVLMLTAAVRDLHLAHPGRYLTDVRTSAAELWAHNPYVTPLADDDPEVRTLEMHYPLVHESNQRPYHFLHGFAQYLEEQLQVRVPITRFHGDIHLSGDEKSPPPPYTERGVPEHYWLIVAGGKFDFTTKWWNPASYQAVVDHFRDRLTFVQCGATDDWHVPLDGVVNLVGATTIRQFVRLMYYASGVVCPLTFAMHLAAAVEVPPGRPALRACVVMAGGREPAHWTAYPHHQFLGQVGQLPCCATGGCWRSRCQLVGDGDPKDWENTCERPVRLSPSLAIPECMARISPQEVIRRIELCCGPSGRQQGVSDERPGEISRPMYMSTAATIRRTVQILFSYDAVAAVMFTAVLRVFRSRNPDWDIAVHSSTQVQQVFESAAKSNGANQ